MPFIPHTDQDIEQMLAEIGAKSIQDLFDEIPSNLKIACLSDIPNGMNEQEVTRLMQQYGELNRPHLSFLGAGAYEHHIPAAVWDIVGRGEFYSAYTPYQAEASQGTLQLLFEFQTMIAQLTGMDVANASLYDGATALAEAILMAARIDQKKKVKRILIPRTLHPHYRKAIKSIVSAQGIELVELPYASDLGKTQLSSLEKWQGQEVTAVVIPQPNFFGILEDVDAFTDWAHQHQALAIGVINPIALGVLKEPGQWGQDGADIVCGEGQPLGVPLAFGGPYLGLMACKQKWIRQLPGRIVGQSVDQVGATAYTLTLQAREQHIRRSKATSNICTNQSLLVTAATIYLSLLGAEGLRRVASACHFKAAQLREKLLTIKGIEPTFSQPIFHEFVIRLPQPLSHVLDELAKNNILPGFDLSHDYPELGRSLLVCATETKNQEDINLYYEKLREIMIKDVPLALEKAN